MSLSRRTFIKAAGLIGATAAAGGAEASAPSASADDTAAILVDVTLCAGCRGCEAACAEANSLPAPDPTAEPGDARHRAATSPNRFTVVNAANPGGEEPRFAKTQCMHCVAPACASACPVRALDKTKEGPVVYHRERCIGCRYCMVACPFGVPKYEYDKAIPYVRKCTFCAERQSKGLPPACASVCPTGALTFGKRGELLEVAKRRIYGSNGKYVPRIYGETEAGGTSWLYISDVPFENLGLPEGLLSRPYPELTSSALAVVPIVMTLWPPLLMGLYAASRRREAVAAEERREKTHE